MYVCVYVAYVCIYLFIYLFISSLIRILIQLFIHLVFAYSYIYFFSLASIISVAKGDRKVMLMYVRDLPVEKLVCTHMSDDMTPFIRSPEFTETYLIGIRTNSTGTYSPATYSPSRFAWCSTFPPSTTNVRRSTV